MIAELSDRVWANPKFQEAAQRAEIAWLKHELGVEADILVSTDEANKLIRAAAILACSEQPQHRETAFRTATCLYDLIPRDALPLEQALRVVLARLGNFPSLQTREDVASAQRLLPLSLLTEELEAADQRSVRINDEILLFTNFQHQLWSTLIARGRAALSAPTSAGKSFVLQNYLVSIFGTGAPEAVVYIVPTRALITQVAADLVTFFRDAGRTAPEIVTVPIDSETALPTQAIYVMTQERVQLSLASHPEFGADVIVVDEAQAISDGSRGVLLQWILDDLLGRNSKAQILFASPNIRNLDVFARVFGISNVREIASKEPTVAQNFLVVTIVNATTGKISIGRMRPETKSLAEVAKLEVGQTLASRVDKLVHIAARLGQHQANIVYANGAADAENIAIQLADLFSSREPTPAQMALSDLARESVHPNYVLVECVKRGVAFHYSNIPTQLRRAIEGAVTRGQIDYLVCTSTLLQGVNLPVRNIFMCAPEKGARRPLESTDFWNLAGRAGRLRQEFQGNIFLIDYINWQKKPLDGPRETVIVPAIESTLINQPSQLVELIRNEAPPKRGGDPALETTFVRLFSDHKRGALETTLARLGLDSSRDDISQIAAALAEAATEISLPEEVIRLSPNISAHKQEKLFHRLKAIVAFGREAAVGLVPSHPRESDAFSSYAAILEQCHEIVLDIDTSRNLHRFHALMALKWMKGLPLPLIIEDQIQREKKRSQRTTIRDALDTIETQIRFQAVRLFGCYNALLVHTFRSAGYSDLVSSIPALPLYLEIGASDKTMISFIALGLSRVTAMKLNELSARKDLDVAGALQWLRTRPLSTLGLSPLLVEEVRATIAAT